MKVRLLRKDTVEEFAESHANGRKHFEKWFSAIEFTDWKVSPNIIATFSGNLLGEKRVVFDLGGYRRNAFRMIGPFEFGRKLMRLYVNWIGTYEEYNKLTNDDKMNVWKY